MKQTLCKTLPIGLALFAFSTASSANQPMAVAEKPEILKEYEMQLEQGKSYRDAFQALQYEIAYEQAAVQSKSPCRKMVRGL